MILPDEVLCSILMDNIPAVYKAAEPLFLAAITKNELKSSVTEWERKRPGRQRQQQTKVANRISAVKQKGQTPTFHQLVGSGRRCSRQFRGLSHHRAG
jgi:hypothetical protein